MGEEDEIDLEKFVPGSYGCHEAMHMASVFGGLVEQELAEHAAIRQNPEWLALAEKSCMALYELYQKIGEVHMETDFPEAHK